MKYRCLVLDHDDTVVESTPFVHYPSFVEAMRLLRPEMKPLTLEEFVAYCFEPGFMGLCSQIMKFDEAELAVQYQLWKKHTQEKEPDFYYGFVEFLTEFREKGGIICVVSHSESMQIKRDYQKHCGFLPDMIFGWELGEERRKPNPYPLLEIMKRFQLSNQELLMVDDLKPGLDMAAACSVDCAGAGWSHIVPEIRSYMELNCNHYFSTVSELRDFVMQEDYDSMVMGEDL